MKLNFRSTYFFKVLKYSQHSGLVGFARNLTTSWSPHVISQRLSKSNQIKTSIYREHKFSQILDQHTLFQGFKHCQHSGLVGFVRNLTTLRPNFTAICRTILTNLDQYFLYIYVLNISIAICQDFCL